jgi:hypothetical protein
VKAQTNTSQKNQVFSVFKIFKILLLWGTYFNIGTQIKFSQISSIKIATKSNKIALKVGVIVKIHQSKPKNIQKIQKAKILQS